jgi:hypothetical protein
MWPFVMLSTIVGVLPAQDAVTSDRNGPQYTRVRSTDGYMIALVRQGYEQSPTFRELVDTLQRSNVIVMVQPGMCAGGRIRSCLVSVSGSERDRHIRIRVDPRHTIKSGLIAAIAHELQHAVEIAEHVEVTNASGALELYRQIAFGRCHEGLSEECETERALVTERAVLIELLRRTVARKVIDSFSDRFLRGLDVKRRYGCPASSSSGCDLIASRCTSAAVGIDTVRILHATWLRCSIPLANRASDLLCLTANCVTRNVTSSLVAIERHTLHDEKTWSVFEPLAVGDGEKHPTGTVDS